MAIDKQKCPVCKTHDAVIDDGPEMHKVKCPLCGHYRISRQQMRGEFGVPKHLLSGVLRNTWESTGAEFNVETHLVDSLASLKKASQFPIPSEIDIPSKADIILRFLSHKSTYPGEYLDIINLNIYSIAYCKTPQEFGFCCDHLKDRGLIRQNPSTSSTSVRVTPTGWAYLSGIGAEAKDQGFIAMAFSLDFSNSLRDDGIIPGIGNAGHFPMRIDRKDHNNRIDDEIVAEIRKSKFVVADLTGNNQGAYFEAGFAHGLGKPVIWTCEKNQLDAKDIHFDVRQYSIVSWEPDKLEDFATRLTQRIEATIGHGKHVPESAAGI